MNVSAANARRTDSAGELEFNRLLRSAAILVVDAEPGMRRFLKRALEIRCALLEVASSAEEAEALRLRYHFDMLLVGIQLPGLSGLDWISKLRELGVRPPVIYMTAHADLDMAVAALRNGADDFIMKPFRIEQIFLSMQRTLMQRQVQRENSLLRLQMEQSQDSYGVVGESEVVRQMLRVARRVAATRSTVLIQGETGVGKELLARVIHDLSRRSGAFVAIRCDADSELIDRTLFGHVQGAVTGADQARDSLVDQADKGTLFLEEIGRLPDPVQVKLLRMLEQGVIRPEGSTREFPVDVRVIAATTYELDRPEDTDAFRTDLFYQLNTMPLRVPPLRERGRDIELLVQHFMGQLSASLRLAPVQLLHADWQRLSSYNWPGNVRELRTLVERTLLVGELPVDSLLGDVADSYGSAAGYPLDWTVDEVERAHMEAVLVSLGNNKSAAARVLGVSRKTLERKQAIWRSAV
jgi:two-component system NtrC family response regulator